MRELTGGSMKQGHRRRPSGDAQVRPRRPSPSLSSIAAWEAQTG